MVYFTNIAEGTMARAHAAGFFTGFGEAARRSGAESSRAVFSSRPLAPAPDLRNFRAT
jgi:hypothetical protein